MQHMSQKGINTNGGDNAGGDINKTINNYPSEQSPLARLIDNLKIEIEQQDKTNDTHEMLELYTENIDREIIGLNEKLKKANKDEKTISRAMKVKEIFSKILAERTFYKSGQKVYSELMNHIYLGFNSNVMPLIEEKAPDHKIEAAVSVVIQDIISKIGVGCDIVSSLEIEGILYYLTGNCHIRWHKKE